MKKFARILGILSVSLILILSSFFCCCFTSLAQAQEPTYSCHQQTEDSQSSQRDEKCDCENILAVKGEQSKQFINPSLNFDYLPASDNRQHVIPSDSTLLENNQSREKIPPIYIINSILRL